MQTLKTPRNTVALWTTQNVPSLTELVVTQEMSEMLSKNV